MKSFSQTLRGFAGFIIVTGCGGGSATLDGDTGASPGTSTATMSPASSTGAAGSSAAAMPSSMAATSQAKPTTPGAAAAGAAAPSTTARPAGTSPAASTGGSGAVTSPDMAPASAAGSAAPATSGAAGGAAAAAGAAAPATGATGPAGMPPLLPVVTTTDGPGPFTGGVEKVKNTPPGGWLIYPKEIGKDGIKHPLFIFGPGGGTTPDTYESMGMHWDRYGSYGFVIYVLPQSTGDGAAMKAGLDWLIEQNDDSSSPLHQKLDITKVCASGHSMGSVTTFDFMPDDRVTTTIHISGGSFDHQGPKNLKNDTMFLCGPSSSADTAVAQCDGDFMTSTVPTFYTQIQGSTHLTSGRLGWEAVIAWMLWHLAGQEEQWKKEFVEPTGKFQMGIYKSQVKNW